MRCVLYREGLSDQYPAHSERQVKLARTTEVTTLVVRPGRVLNVFGTARLDTTGRVIMEPTQWESARPDFLSLVTKSEMLRDSVSSVHWQETLSFTMLGVSALSTIWCGLLVNSRR